MPELPEVETTVQGLIKHCKHHTITRVVFHRENIRYPLNPTWVEWLANKQITEISRRAKCIMMTAQDTYLLWHLGMSGSMRICQPDEVRKKHDHIECFLSSGHILRYHDPRRFGYLQCFRDAALREQSIAHYGVEPLGEAFNGDYLWQCSRKKQQAVKNFIMNQNVVVGVGNIYACEALFLAGIAPQKPVGKLSKTACQTLVTQIKSVLKQAIAQGGTTLNDFINADAKPGYFQQTLAVYGRKDNPCPRCKTPISTVKLGGRNSFYCHSCQPMAR